MITGPTKFAADEIARKVFALAGPGAPVVDLADQWAALADDALARAGADHVRELLAQQKSKGDVVTGVFSGIATTGHVSVYRATLKIAATEPIKFTNIIEPAPLNSKKPVIYFGATEISNEFVANSTDRARKSNATPGNIPALGAVHRAAFIYELVKFVITFAGDKDIGGTPSVVILDSKSGLRWFRRPNFCPEK